MMVVVVVVVTPRQPKVSPGFWVDFECSGYVSFKSGMEDEKFAQNVPRFRAKREEE